MKYRMLTQIELESLEKEFIDFLVINGIAAEDWARIKQEDSHQTTHLIAAFSDVVFESIMKTTSFLTIKNQNEIKCYQCLTDKIVMIALTVTKNNSKEIDLSVDNFLDQLSQPIPEYLYIFQADKIYKNEREMEVFQLYESGGIKSDGHLFKKLWLLYIDQ